MTGRNQRVSDVLKNILGRDEGVEHSKFFLFYGKCNLK